jgi:hypothetical protein
MAAPPSSPPPPRRLTNSQSLYSVPHSRSEALGQRCRRGLPATSGSRSKRTKGHSWQPLVHNRPGRLEPFIRNTISRDKLVHQPIVRRPAPPRRLLQVLVLGRVIAKAQAQLASVPEGSVKLSLSLGGVGKLVSAPRPNVTAAGRQVPGRMGRPFELRFAVGAARGARLRPECRWTTAQ